MDSLISCCAAAGVGEWVCCPGAMNAPLLQALACCPEVHRWQLQEERSAAFFALGRIQATARAVAVVAGSGSSAAALMPAVIEAYYQRRPLIIITIDSFAPTEGSGAYGRIEQDSLFGFYAPSVHLQLPCSVGELPDMEALCSEGFPVHIHLCCAEGVRCGGGLCHVAEPPAPPAFRGSLAALAQVLRFRAHMGLVLMLGELDPLEQEPALWLARTLRVPVVADATSGLREKLAPLLLHGAEAILAANPPRYVLRLGGVPSSAFWSSLEELPGTEVFSITRSGFAGLRRPSEVIEGDPEQIMKAMGDISSVGDTMGLIPKSRKVLAHLEEHIFSYPESAEALVRAFSRYACLADVMFLGSPSVTQLWNKAAQLQVAQLYVRSVALSGGADGVISAFLGNAVDSPFSCALVGDLSLLRDLAGAGICSQLPAGKRVIAVLNNEGAGLAIPQAATSEQRRLMVQAPDFDLQEVARLCRAEYYTIRSEADLEVMESLEDHSLVILDLQPEK